MGSKGGFTEVTSGPAVSSSSNSHDAMAGDVNNDGAMDLYVVNLGKFAGRADTNQLFLGDGKGGFVEVTSGPAVTRNSYSFGGAIGDFNRDGVSPSTPLTTPHASLACLAIICTIVVQSRCYSDSINGGRESVL